MNDITILESQQSGKEMKNESSIICSMDDFSLRQPVERILRSWVLIFFFCVLGGVAGWLISDAQPAQYEAEARFHLYVNTVQTGKIERLDIDTITQTAGWVMSNPAVLGQVISQAAAQGIQVDAGKMLQIFFPEQRGETWIMRVRYPDAQAAANLANLWAEIGGQALSDAIQHTDRAQFYRRYMETLQSCLMQAYVTEPATAQCAADNIQKIQSDLETTGQLYLQEKGAAHGVSPALEFSFENPASVPGIPVRQQRSTLILAGAFLGLLIGGWAVSAGMAERFRKERRGR